MKFRKVINKPSARHDEGISVAGGINAVISANTGERSATNQVSSKQKVRIVQRGGKTEVFEQESSSDAGPDEE